MSNTQRPSLAPKHTPKTEKKREEAQEFGVSVAVNGVTYTVREADLTSLDTMTLRRETGMTFVSLMEAFGTSPDIDLIAALVWLSRRIDGEQMLPFAAVAREIGYDVDIEVIGQAEPESDPQT